jgi:hypothetical protein
VTEEKDMQSPSMWIAVTILVLGIVLLIVKLVRR